MQIFEAISLTTIGWIALAVLIITVFLQSVRYIPNNRVGIVEKRCSRRGSVKSGFIALNGEAGFQPEVLRGGWHLLMPFSTASTACRW